MTVEVTNPLHALPAEMWQAGHVDFYQKFVRQGPFFVVDDCSFRHRPARLPRLPELLDFHQVRACLQMLMGELRCSFGFRLKQPQKGDPRHNFSGSTSTCQEYVFGQSMTCNHQSQKVRHAPQGKSKGTSQSIESHMVNETWSMQQINPLWGMCSIQTANKTKPGVVGSRSPSAAFDPSRVSTARPGTEVVFESSAGAVTALWEGWPVYPSLQQVFLSPLTRLALIRDTRHRGLVVPVIHPSWCKVDVDQAQ